MLQDARTTNYSHFSISIFHVILFFYTLSSPNFQENKIEILRHSQQNT